MVGGVRGTSGAPVQSAADKESAREHDDAIGQRLSEVVLRVRETAQRTSRARWIHVQVTDGQ